MYKAHGIRNNTLHAKLLCPPFVYSHKIALHFMIYEYLYRLARISEIVNTPDNQFPCKAYFMIISPNQDSNAAV